jgi:hypothetical protein
MYVGCNPLTEISETVKQRAKADASSAETRGRCTTSAIPAATKASTPASSADPLASRIGTSGTVS